MSNRTSRTVLGIIALCAIVAAATAFAASRTAQDRSDARGQTSGAPATEQSVPHFTLTSSQTSTSTESGQSVVRATKTLYRRADASFAEVTQYLTPNGTTPHITDTQLGVIGRGLFRVNDAQRVISFIAPLPAQVATGTMAEMRRKSQYVRDETVLSYETAVLRYPTATARTFYTEYYYAPALQSIIKVVAVAPQSMEITEPTGIQVGLPDVRRFRPLVDYTIDTASFDEKARLAEQQGDNIVAAELRAHIRRAKLQP